MRFVILVVGVVIAEAINPAYIQQLSGGVIHFIAAIILIAAVMDNTEFFGALF